MKFNIIGPVNCLSYGYITQNLIKSLLNLGHQINLSCIGPFQPDEVYSEYVNQCSDKLDDVSPDVIIWHHFDLKRFVRPGLLNIGFPVFETNHFSQEEVKNLNSVDILLTTSSWYKEILKKNVRNDLPIYVVPLGVGTDIFHKEEKTNDNGIVKFLNIGKWEIRKGHYELVKCFGEVFKDYDDVSLTLACDNPFIGADNQKWVNFAHKFIPEHKINILPLRFNSCVDVAKLIHSHDIGIFPSKAEGFNMPLSECLACEKLCIATDYSAHTEFATKENCLLIPIEESEKMFDGQFFVGNGGTWAKLGTKQIDSLKNLMEFAYRSVKSGDFHKNLQRRSSSLLEGFSWQNTASKIIGVIENV